MAGAIVPRIRDRSDLTAGATGRIRCLSVMGRIANRTSRGTVVIIVAVGTIPRIGNRSGLTAGATARIRVLSVMRRGTNATTAFVIFVLGRSHIRPRTGTGIANLSLVADTAIRRDVPRYVIVVYLLAAGFPRTRYFRHTLRGRTDIRKIFTKRIIFI